MQIERRNVGEVNIIRVKEPSLTYPVLGPFSDCIYELVENGARKLVVDLSETRDLDAASFGCLIDIYRMLSKRGGTMKLVGLQDRVEMMARMVHITQLVEVLGDAETAVKSF